MHCGADYVDEDWKFTIHLMQNAPSFSWRRQLQSQKKQMVLHTASGVCRVDIAGWSCSPKGLSVLYMFHVHLSQGSTAQQITFGGECSDPGQWDWMEFLKLSTIFCAGNFKLFLLREDTIKWNRKRSEKTRIYPGALYKLSTRGWSNQHVVLLPLHSTGTR